MNLLSDDETKIGYTPEFEKFWKTFPASDKYLHYPETRKLRAVKRETYKNFLDCLKNGYSAAYLILTLETDIMHRKSLPNRENPFKFMKGSPKWLLDEAFLEVETYVPNIPVNNEDLM